MNVEMEIVKTLNRLRAGVERDAADALRRVYRLTETEWIEVARGQREHPAVEAERLRREREAEQRARVVASMEGLGESLGDLLGHLKRTAEAFNAGLRKGFGL